MSQLNLAFATVSAVGVSMFFPQKMIRLTLSIASNIVRARLQINLTASCRMDRDTIFGTASDLDGSTQT